MFRRRRQYLHENRNQWHGFWLEQSIISNAPKSACKLSYRRIEPVAPRDHASDSMSPSLTHCVPQACEGSTPPAIMACMLVNRQAMMRSALAIHQGLGPVLYKARRSCAPNVVYRTRSQHGRGRDAVSIELVHHDAGPHPPRIQHRGAENMGAGRMQLAAQHQAERVGEKVAPAALDRFPASCHAYRRASGSTLRLRLSTIARACHGRAPTPARRSRLASSHRRCCAAESLVAASAIGPRSAANSRRDWRRSSSPTHLDSNKESLDRPRPINCFVRWL
jgi:hypothetical protein